MSQPNQPKSVGGAFVSLCFVRVMREIAACTLQSLGVALQGAGAASAAAVAAKEECTGCTAEVAQQSNQV